MKLWGYAVCVAFATQGVESYNPPRSNENPAKGIGSERLPPPSRAMQHRRRTILDESSTDFSRRRFDASPGSHSSLPLRWRAPLPFSPPAVCDRHDRACGRVEEEEEREGSPIYNDIEEGAGTDPAYGTPIDDHTYASISSEYDEITQPATAIISNPATHTHTQIPATHTQIPANPATHTHTHTQIPATPATPATHTHTQNPATPAAHTHTHTQNPAPQSQNPASRDVDLQRGVEGRLSADSLSSDSVLPDSTSGSSSGSASLTLSLSSSPTYYTPPSSPSADSGTGTSCGSSVGEEEDGRGLDVDLDFGHHYDSVAEFRGVTPPPLPSREQFAPRSASMSALPPPPGAAAPRWRPSSFLSRAACPAQRRWIGAFASRSLAHSQSIREAVHRIPTQVRHAIDKVAKIVSTPDEDQNFSDLENAYGFFDHSFGFELEQKCTPTETHCKPVVGKHRRACHMYDGDDFGNPVPPRNPVPLSNPVPTRNPVPLRKPQPLPKPQSMHHRLATRGFSLD